MWVLKCYSYFYDDNDNEIANNILRKVTIPNENKAEKNRKKNNDTRF